MLSADHDRAAAQPLPVQVDALLQFASGHHTRSRLPGTSRADRGRSRHPVASSTARARTASIPAWLVSVAAIAPACPAGVAGSLPSAAGPLPQLCQAVTVVPVRNVTPAALAAWR